MEDDQEERISPNIPRHRSPVFYREEVKVLLDLINEYKEFVLNKSTTSSASRAKDLAWIKITNKFNSHGFKNIRTIDGLKYKWRNLINNVKRQSKNLLDVNQEELDEFSNQVLSLLNDEEIHNSEVVLPSDFEEVLKEQGKLSSINKKQIWDDNREQDDSSGDENKIARNRSMNFSPQDCRLLLKCVQAERKYIFTTDLSSKTRNMKNAAWSRITVEYNRKSEEKRSKKVLQRKFLNMKHLTKKAGVIRYFKNNGIKRNVENYSKEPEIKPEPLCEEEDEELNDNDDNCDNDDHLDIDANDDLRVDDPDPLSMVLNSDSGLGSSVNIGTFNPFESSEEAKLKIELLKYKIEKAKLKKIRIENAIREDEKAHELNAIDRALRLRAARLEVAAAEMKLPPAHPTLLFTAEELPAQAYLKQYQT